MQSILELALSLSGFYIFIALGYLTTRITPKAVEINKKLTLILLYLLIPLLIINTLLTFNTELLNELKCQIAFGFDLYYCGYSFCLNMLILKIHH